MRRGHDLILEQSQQLVMTRELRQALAILQMTALELKQHLQDVLSQNPLLEELESDFSPELDGDDLPEWAEYFSDASDLGLPPQEPQPTHRDWSPDRTSLYEQLSRQLVFEDFDARDELIARFILGCLDDEGFLQGEPDELAQAAGCESDRFHKVWGIIRTWEPPGIAARDLRDCLKLQLRRGGHEDELLYRVIDDHLLEIMSGKFNGLARVLGCSPHRIQEMATILGGLNPHPGSAMSQAPVNYTLPDVSVHQVGDEYYVIVHENYWPRLGLNQYYLQLLRNSPDTSTKHFLRQKFKHGTWILRSIEQRKLTLYRVACCVVERQADFFRKGARGLVPLTLQTVADELGVHESTVSRAVAGKYINTPHGLFPFSFFFPSSLARGVSSETARVAMRELIAGEDARKPLTDSALSCLLAEEGIPLSRRTVAKYRHGLGIPAVHRRRVH